jgi:hypothetical protein
MFCTVRRNSADRENGRPGEKTRMLLRSYVFYCILSIDGYQEVANVQNNNIKTG